MSRPLGSLLAPLLFALCLGLALPASAATRRFALIAAANDGGPDRAVLRFARSDAEAVSELLEELGGVAPGDRILAVDTDREGLEAALVTARERLAAVRKGEDRLELIFYYSGHSDETGLLLGRHRLPYRELRAALETIDADVRIAVLDSCASGALTRTKGGVSRPSFLMDESREVKGQAILTSSSADEASQESDRIGGSFFTHYLVSGLRGAADSDADQTVTLSEAYQFAFKETLARTERTQGGAQHPNYDFRLSGTGDVVMTDLRSASSSLVIDAEVAGRVYLRDAEGHLLAELRKPAGNPVVLGLRPGTYEVTLDDGRELSAGRVTLSPGAPTGLSMDGLRTIPRERAVARGDLPPAGLSELPRRFLGSGLVPWPARRPESNNLQLGLLGANSTELHGFALNLGISVVEEDFSGLQLSLVANSAGRGSGTQWSLAGNLVGSPAQMLQLSVGANVARGSLSWGQLSVGANIVGGDLKGLQLSVGANIVGRDLRGLQLTAGFNVANNSSGLQGSAGANIATGDMYGLQLTAGVNLARRVRGAQLAAGLNIAHGPVTGTQIAAGINVAPEVDGTQIAVVNVATKATGLQVGVVNIAIDGAEAETLGLLNIVGGGIHRVRLWGDDVHLLNAGLKLGGKHLYSVLSMGLMPGTTPLRFTAQAGIGAEFTLLGPLFLNLELTAGGEFFGTFSMPGYSLTSRFSAVAGLELAKHLRIVGGLSLNGWHSDQQSGEELAWLGPQFTYTSGRHTTRLWPGLLLGVEF